MNLSFRSRLSMPVLAVAVFSLHMSLHHLQSRHKTGAVTIRGVATAVHSHGFTLQTTHRGTFSVAVLSATNTTEKGVSGKLSVHAGDHVGVHGFLAGRQIRAISIRIYPVKPPQSSLKGTITSVSASQIVVDAGGKSFTVAISSSTLIKVGSTPSTRRALHVGDSIEVRVANVHGRLEALHIHIYSHKAAQRHAKLTGTVASVTPGSVAVRSGNTTTVVSVTSQTVIYDGSSRSSARALTQGKAVTVYACCVGRPLTATSIHVRKTAAHVASLTLRGQIVSLAPGGIRLATGSSTVTVRLQSSTTFEVGSTRVNSSALRVGDQASVRGVMTGSVLLATRVHVFASSRLPRTVRGSVVGVSSTSVTVVGRGRKYLIRLAPGATVVINGQRSYLRSIKLGDHATATCHLDSSGALTASSVLVKHKIPKPVSVHGILVSSQGNILVVVDSSGVRHSVRVSGGTHILIHGSPAPTGALFPGVHLSVRGTVSGSTLEAETVTIAVSTKTIHGRVLHVSVAHLLLRVSSQTTDDIVLPGGLRVIDGKKRPVPTGLHVGVFVQVTGFRQTATVLRATSITIIHPALSLSALIVATKPGVTIQTNDGQRYVLGFPSSAVISTGRAAVALTPSQLPVNVRAHVEGTMTSSGTLTVDILTVRLTSVTVAGRVSALNNRNWTIAGPTAAPANIILGDQTAISQGSHSLTPGDVVVGDEVTVFGYAGSSSFIFARKIDVHRRLTGVDGSVTSLSSDGFTILVTGTSTRVIISSSTIYTGGAGSDVAPNASVHVTGYLRGDGVILATRVRILKRAA